MKDERGLDNASSEDCEVEMMQKWQANGAARQKVSICRAPSQQHGYLRAQRLSSGSNHVRSLEACRNLNPKRKADFGLITRLSSDSGSRAQSRSLLQRRFQAIYTCCIEKEKRCAGRALRYRHSTVVVTAFKAKDQEKLGLVQVSYSAERTARSSISRKRSSAAQTGNP